MIILNLLVLKSVLPTIWSHLRLITYLRSLKSSIFWWWKMRGTLWSISCTSCSHTSICTWVLPLRSSSKSIVINHCLILAESSIINQIIRILFSLWHEKFKVWIIISTRVISFIIWGKVIIVLSSLKRNILLE